jgi:hypothetical protein
MRFLQPLVATCLLAGCVSNPLYKENPAEFTDRWLLNVYSGILQQRREGHVYDPERAAAVDVEIAKRKFDIRNSSWPDIRAGRVAIGMTKSEVVASWGNPHEVNKSISAGGTSEQWCYGEIGESKLQFVYFQGGRVYHIQG